MLDMFFNKPVETIVGVFVAYIILNLLLSRRFRDRLERIVLGVILFIIVMAISLALAYWSVQNTTSSLMQITQPTPTIIVPAAPQEELRTPSTTEHTTYLPFVAQ